MENNKQNDFLERFDLEEFKLSPVDEIVYMLLLTFFISGTEEVSIDTLHTIAIYQGNNISKNDIIDSILNLRHIDIAYIVGKELNISHLLNAEIEFVKQFRSFSTKGPLKIAESYISVRSVKLHRFDIYTELHSLPRLYRFKQLELDNKGDLKGFKR